MTLAMKRVAEMLQALESTTKRLEITSILAKLFHEAKDDEIDKLVYLLHGQLGPPYEAPDFGVDERSIIIALANATDTSKEKVEELYRQKGDLGSTAEEMLREQGAGLNLIAVFESLRQIALARGAGAHERKIRLLADIIKRSAGIEARYILRMLQGKLRLGVGDATIMDALSEAIAGDRSLRDLIERAYSICSDLGYIARLAKAEGRRALETIKPRVGKPILVELAERLPSPEAIIQKMGLVEAEPKYDGLRLQLHKDGESIRFFTRRLEDVTGMFPELAKAALWQINAERAIIDGEAVVFNPETGEFLPFQVTVRRKRKYGIEEMEARYPLRYFAFDLLYFDNTDMTRARLIERRQKLEEIVKSDTDFPIQVTEHINTADPVELDQFFQDCIARGLEGIVVKKPDVPYQAGKRSFNWVKLKRSYRAELSETVDVVIVGYLLGKGKRSKFGIGSVLGAVYDAENDRFRTITKIGSGLSEEEWADLKRRLDEISVPSQPTRVDSLIIPDVWTEPRYVVEVQADEITRSPRHTCGKVGEEPGYALRFPRIVNLRWDKRPEDATTEQEIVEMYQMQKAGEVEAPRRVARRGQRAA